jgi:conjugative relaxase-like TrwC/TraI family protein
MPESGYNCSMIRMIQCLSAVQAKSYFNDALSKSDYYLNDQEIAGSLHGRIAERLGLPGAITKEVFHAFCDNINPVTGQPLTLRTNEYRRVGYDINFHVPKSVSVLHALAKDNHMLDAFRVSVQEIMCEIETDAKTRVRKGGKKEDRLTGELAWAEFIHQTARPVENFVPDCHLHCHCLVWNVTYDPIEQQYKAGEFGDIKRDMPYYQAKFHKQLSDKLIALGYQIRRTSKAFEVVGVPQPVIDLFSKRTDEIGQVAKVKGITDAKGLDSLGARTRAKKQKGLTLAELKKNWRKQIFSAGMNKGDGGDSLIRFAPAASQPELSAAACVDHALLARLERASVARDRRILETAYRFATGNAAVSADAITQSFRQDSRIIHVKEKSGMMCTTKQVLAEERHMVKLAQKSKGSLLPLYLNAPALKSTGEHAEAITHVLTTPDRVSILLGGAGTGKTTLMQEAVPLIEAAIGKPVVIVAPTAEAARGVLRQEGFTNAETVAKLLASPELQKQLQGGVLWVDEAGLLGIRDMTALLALAERYNARVLLAGDTRQHTSVIRGDALRILNIVAGIKAAEVSRIYRQRDKGYRDAVQALAVGNIKAGFD